MKALVRRGGGGYLLGAALVMAWGLGPGVARATPVYLTTVAAGCNAPKTVISHGGPADAIACASGAVSASGTVDSGIGFIRSEATAAASLASAGSTVSAQGQGVTRFQDSFLVAALDSSGNGVTSGFLTAIVDVDASASAGASGFGSVLWNFSVGSESRDGRALATMPFGNSSSTSGGLFVLQVPWSAGTGVGITFFANAEATVAINQAGTASGHGDFMNSMEWLGISEVTDGNGVPVLSFSALSNEGVDYALAVPEPQSALLVLVSLLGVGLQRHGRRRSEKR